MSGSLSQLAAVGLQSSTAQSDSYLPWKCQITRPAPFAMEVKDISCTGQKELGKKVCFSVHYSADLLCKPHLVVDFQASPDATQQSTLKSFFFQDTKDADNNPNTPSEDSVIEQVEDLGHAMIEELTLKIGSVTQLTVPGEWLHVKETLTRPYSHRSKEFTGRTSDGGGIQSALKGIHFQQQRLYIELPFWFSDYCNAVPLVALHLSDINIDIRFRKKDQLFRFVNGATDFSGVTATLDDYLVVDDMRVIAEYVFLTDQHRRIFAGTDHFYLVEQVQNRVVSIPAGVKSHNERLELNHMVKELVWYGRKSDQFSTNVVATNKHCMQYFNFQGEEDGTSFGTAVGDLFKTAQISINNNVRVQAMDPKYYRLVHPRNVNHTNVPKEFVYCYSFALEAERQNPTGTINASRIENLSLLLNFTKDTGLTTGVDLFIHGVSYNVVSIRSGTGSLLYSS